jgi:hypothetical protein
MSTVTISLTVHLLAWGLVVWTGALNPAIILAKKPETKRELKLDFIKPRPKPKITIVAQPTPPPPAQPKPSKNKKLPNIFVQVDPKQASTKKPNDTDNYSNKNSLAANPEPSNKPKPKIDGSRKEIPRTHDISQPAKAKLEPAQPPTPNATSKPLGDVGPKPEPASPAPSVVSQPNVRPQNPYTPIPKRGPKFSAKTSVSINLAKSTPLLPPTTLIDTPSILLEPGPPQPKETSPLERAKRRLAKAKRSGSQLLHGKTRRQEGGAARKAIPAENVMLTGYGDYDEKLITAIYNSWVRKNKELRRHQPYRVVVGFELLSSGRIENLRLKRANSVLPQSIPEFICKRSIEEPAPFERWDETMKRTLGTRRPCRITFSFNIRD